MEKFYFIAGNTFGGCGHRHRTASAAKPCIPKVEHDFEGGRYLGVYKMTKDTDGRMVIRHNSGKR
jgi:hypothetical protein